MNAPGQAQFQTQFPGHPQMHPNQQNPGQARQGQGQGQGQQSFQNAAQQQRSPNQLFYDPRLQQWTLKKGKKSSWAEVEPRQQHVSYDSLAEELENMLETIRKEKTSVQRLLNEIPSDNAHSKVSDLLKAQNAELFKLNSKLQWNIAGIRLAWTVIQHTFTPDERRLKRIDIILKTEQRAPMPGAGAKGGAANGMQQNQKPLAQGMGQNIKNPQNQGFNNVQDGHLNQGQGRDQGMNHGGPPPPPPPPPPPGPHSGPGMPVLPSPPGGGQQQQQPGFQQPGMANPGMFAEHAAFPSMRHESQRFNGPEILNAHILKKQKSKSKILPGRFPSESEGDSDSGSDSESIGSDSASIISMDEPGYNTIGGGGRKSSHKKNKSKRHNQRRDSGYTDPHKSQKQKTSYGRSGPDFQPPPMGKHSGHKSSQQSPRSSNSSFKPPVVQVHVHNGTTAQNEREHDRENDRDRHNGRDLYRSEREPALRQASYNISPPRSLKDSFNKVDKFTGGVPMSRNSSTSTSRDSYTSGEENASSASYDADSQFSEPMQPQRSRGNERYPRERLDQSYHNDVHRSKRDYHNDYPHQERPRHHRRRSHIPTVHMDHDVEGPYYGEDPSIVGVVQRPGLRRNSTQVYPSYGREQPRYPHSRSMSYSEEPYYPPPKALQDSQANYHDDGVHVPDVESIVAATVSALQQQKALDAVEHMRRSQRPLIDRRGSLSGRGRERYDPWAASQQPEYSSANPMSGIGRRGPVYSGYRHVDI
ncbi:hypothetical protein BDV96DRAFT_601730 [Lophiotrema nucula]|uniref:Uncharacterized protein n=1 Tax=Lophiotrema nucula TaxID=690887 RepID=A0A6A5Z0F5_9PLEO|nr:hypothetical protein BDV96DRAFT_601730 [Lophiotrema nucula]